MWRAPALASCVGITRFSSLDRGELPWSVHGTDAGAVNAISIDPPPFTDDMVHESAKHALAQRGKYARWLDSQDPLVVANAMLIIIGRALNMLKAQIAAQGKAFEETGGFSERLYTRRLEVREDRRAGEPAPDCPLCGEPMRRRRSANGEFWGCGGYPACRGTKEI